MSTTATTRSINYGQLATATDRLLVLGLPRKRPRPTLHTVIRPAMALRKPASRRLPALGAAIAIGILLGFATTRVATIAQPAIAHLELR